MLRRYIFMKVGWLFLLVISLFILVLMFVFLLPFFVIFRSFGFDWMDSLFFSLVSFGGFPGLLWLVGGKMSLTQALFWVNGLMYFIVFVFFCVWMYRKTGGGWAFGNM